MVSHKYRCIFIHIPKCAGTSIEVALGHFDRHEGRAGQDHRSIRMIEQPLFSPSTFSSGENMKEALRRLKHLYFNKKANPQNKVGVTKEQYQDYFKFTIVRNPWERAFSWYKNVIRDERHLQRHEITADIPFSEFLKKFMGKGMLRSQLYWLKSFDGSIPMDYIGRFESLKEDSQEIFDRLGLKGQTLPHKIKGQKVDFREFYDEESIALVGNFYKEEIDMFGYSYHGDHERQPS